MGRKKNTAPDVGADGLDDMEKKLEAEGYKHTHLHFELNKHKYDFNFWSGERSGKSKDCFTIEEMQVQVSPDELRSTKKKILKMDSATRKVFMNRWIFKKMKPVAAKDVFLDRIEPLAEAFLYVLFAKDLENDPQTTLSHFTADDKDVVGV